MAHLWDFAWVLHGLEGAGKTHLGEPLHALVCAFVDGVDLLADKRVPPLLVALRTLAHGLQREGGGGGEGRRGGKCGTRGRGRGREVERG